MYNSTKIAIPDDVVLDSPSGIYESKSIVIKFQIRKPLASIATSSS